MKKDKGVLGLALALALTLGPSALSQEAEKTQALPGHAEPPAQVAPDSPRAALDEFLSLANSGDFGSAAAFLDLAPDQRSRGRDLAERLKAVLDRHLWIDLEAVSPLSGGDLEDGLPEAFEQVGSVPSGGRGEPVRLARREAEAGSRWLISRGTLARVDHWYAELDDRWIRAYLPESLLRFGPRQLRIWQWLALPLLFAVAWYVGRALSWLTRRAGGALAARTSSDWDDRLLGALRVPLALAWAVAVAHPLRRFLALNPAGDQFVTAGLSAAAVVALFAALHGVVEVMGEGARRAHWYVSNPSAQAALGLAVRAGKVLVAALGAVAVLVELGYPVASVLAGLGIGGIGLALAAQKTVENLFGSVSLAVDEAVRIGDFVRVDGTLGHVETIGLRSTRIRTLDRTLVSIPNGVLAGLRIESYTARDRVRFFATIGLEYGTTAAQMREVMKGIEEVLRAHPLIWPDDVSVSFQQFGAYSLDIEVMAWFLTDWGNFKKLRPGVLLQIMEVVERAGASFAFPTQTLNLRREERA